MGFNRYLKAVTIRKNMKQADLCRITGHTDLSHVRIYKRQEKSLSAMPVLIADAQHFWMICRAGV